MLVSNLPIVVKGWAHFKKSFLLNCSIDNQYVTCCIKADFRLFKVDSRIKHFFSFRPSFLTACINIEGILRAFYQCAHIIYSRVFTLLKYLPERRLHSHETVAQCAYPAACGLLNSNFRRASISSDSAPAYSWDIRCGHLLRRILPGNSHEKRGHSSSVPS